MNVPVSTSTAGRPSKGPLGDAAATAAAAMQRASIQIRPLQTLQQMQAACAALDRVWGIGPGQTSEVQPPLLRALGHGGNYLVGAYGPDGALVGASVGFFTEPLGAAMHSHITGVLPGVAGAGVGAAMKWHQRQWALERGLARITWTYDPLIARNSFFNLTRLGARPETYFVDFYGVMHDGANRGQPTDRMQVGWDLSAVSTLDAQRVVLERRPTSQGPDTDRAIRTGAATLLSVGPAGEPVSGEPVAGNTAGAVIAIPADIEALRRDRADLALAWRYALRATLVPVMADRSWQITGFARSGGYRLERTPGERGRTDQAAR